jgi:hypothetical protein
MTVHPADLGSTTQDYLGRSQFPTDPYLNGEIDDVGVCSSALSATQIAALASGQPAAGDVADYKFDETGGATATDSSGHGRDATMTGSGWNINTEGTPSNLGGFATYADQDVGGLRTGSSTVISFKVNVPQAGDYLMRAFGGSNAQAPDVSGPTNILARVDGGSPVQIWLPDGYGWVIWNYGSAMLPLTAGAHTISLSTVGAGGAATHGDAIIDKIDLQQQRPPDSVIYEAEQAQLDGGARADYRPQGQSGSGAADITRGQDATFWVYSAADGYSDLAFRYRGEGTAGVSVNALPLAGGLAPRRGRPAAPGWSAQTDRVYLSAAISKVVVAGRGGEVTLDKLTVTPVPGAVPRARTYQAEDAARAGTAKVINGYSQANGGVVTGVGGGPAPADISVNGGSTSISRTPSTGTSSGISPFRFGYGRGPTPSPSSPTPSTTGTARRSATSIRAATSGIRSARRPHRTSTRSRWRHSS